MYKSVISQDIREVLFTNGNLFKSGEALVPFDYLLYSKNDYVNNEAKIGVYVTPTGEANLSLQSNPITVPYLFDITGRNFETILDNSQNVNLSVGNQYYENSIDMSNLSNISITDENFNADIQSQDTMNLSVTNSALEMFLPTDQTYLIDGNIEFKEMIVDTRENQAISALSLYLESVVSTYSKTSITGNMLILEAYADVNSYLNLYKSTDTLWTDTHGVTHTLGRNGDSKNGIIDIGTMRYDFSNRSKKAATFLKSKLDRYEYDVTGPTVRVVSNILYYRQEQNIFRRSTVMTSNDTPDKKPVIEKFYVDPKTLKVNYFDNPRLIVE